MPSVKTSLLASVMLAAPFAAIFVNQHSTESCGLVFDEARFQIVSSLDSETFGKLQSERSVAKADVCQMPLKSLKKSIARINYPKPDHPGEAQAFRQMQIVSEDKKLNVENWHKARIQANAMRAQVKHGAGINSTLWENLGPGNIGGRIRSFAFDPDDSNRIFAGSVAGGVWVTENSGGTWSPADDFMANLSVTSLIFDPTNTDTLYAGTGEGMYNIDAIRGMGIFRSTDNGATWQGVASTQNNSSFYYVNRLVMLSDSSRLIAATNSGIYVSTDDGASWTRTSTSRTNDIGVDPNNDDNLIAGAWGGARYSTDGGSSWTSATGFSGISNSRVEIAYAKSNPQIVFASIDANNGQLWRSTDGGQSYSLINDGNAFLSGQGWYDNALWVDPTNSDHLIAGGVDLYRSTDGGVNMSKISTWWQAPASAHADHHFIMEHPDYDGVNNKQVFFANDGGMYTTPDVTIAQGNSGWQELNNNLSITQFYGMGVSPDGTVVAGAQDNGTLVYKGDSEGWTDTYGGDGGYSAADPTDSNYLYGEYVYLEIHRSTNGGVFSQVIASNDMTSDGANFIAPFTLDPNDENRMLGGASQLWVSDNVKSGSPSWSSRKSNNPGSSAISAIAVAAGNSDIVYVGHNDGSLYKTTDGTSASPTWSQVASNAMPQRNLLRIAVDPLDIETLYASFGGYNSNNLWKSTDGGTSWTVATGNGLNSLPPAPIRGIAVHQEISGFVYVGTEVGIFTSEDGGNNWSIENDGPANVSVDELVWGDANTLYAATHGRGVYRARVNDDYPDNMSFEQQNDLPLNTQVETLPQLINGIGVEVDVTIVDGEYSLGCTGIYTAAAGRANNGDTLCLRHTSANDFYTRVTSQVTIGRQTFSFVSRTIGDSTPEPFSFNAVTDVEVGTAQQSNSVVVTDISDEMDISVTNGEYSIGCIGANFTSASDFIDEGQSVCVRHTASNENLETIETRLTVGDFTTGFSSTTVADTTPDAFSFGSRDDVELSSVETSPQISLTGFQVEVPISVVGGDYSIGCNPAAFTSSNGVVSPEQTVCVRHTSANINNTDTTTQVTVNGVSGSFTTTTTADRTPDNFSFNAVTDVDVNALQTSNTVTVNGLGVAVNISVTAGLYSIGCNGSFTNTAGSINNGQTVCVQHTSSAENNAITQTLLTVGDFSTDFSSTTIPDMLPDAFAFAPVNDVLRSSVQTSAAVTLTGFQVNVPISVTGGLYSIGCNTSFTSNTGMVNPGQSVCVRHTASSESLTATTTTLNVNGISASFVSTTQSDWDPETFAFTPINGVETSTLQMSETVTVEGISNQIPIAITNGEYSISCDADTFTTETSSINNGETLCVRHTAASGNGQTVSTQLTVGNFSVNFETTTLFDTTPDSFSFAAIEDAAISSLQTSEAVTISGIQVAAPIAVSGGEYSLGCSNTFTNIAATIEPGQLVCVRHTASNNYLTATSTLLDVNGVTAEFTSTTSADIEPDSFSFTTVNDAELSSLLTSNSVVINGIAIPVTVNITGGDYSIGCDGTFTDVQGSISNGESLCVRHTSSANNSATVETTISVGSSQTTFSSTTKTAIVIGGDPDESEGGGGSFGWLYLLSLGLLIRRSRG